MKFRELGSARQVLLWLRDSNLKLPIVRRDLRGTRIEWRAPAYHNVRIIEGRARKTTGHRKPMGTWNVLLRDHHRGYISWQDFERNQVMISENAHMQKRRSRKSARGGRALLTGLVRCGRCARMMRVFYGPARAFVLDEEHAAVPACEKGSRRRRRERPPLRPHPSAPGFSIRTER